MSDDITFCIDEKCEEADCYKHPSKIHDRSIPHSFAMFTNCEHWTRGDDIAEFLGETKDERE